MLTPVFNKDLELITVLDLTSKELDPLNDGRSLNIVVHPGRMFPMWRQADTFEPVLSRLQTTKGNTDIMPAQLPRAELKPGRFIHRGMKKVFLFAMKKEEEDLLRQTMGRNEDGK